MFVFFKQKTAYEIQYGLVGSEMCIRDRSDEGGDILVVAPGQLVPHDDHCNAARKADQDKACLLYTSDAADERSSVDLGGRRIIKKKK